MECSKGSITPPYFAWGVHLDFHEGFWVDFLIFWECLKHDLTLYQLYNELWANSQAFWVGARIEATTWDAMELNLGTLQQFWTQFCYQTTTNLETGHVLKQKL